MEDSETKNELLSDFIKATRNLIESNKFERGADDSTFIHGLTNPINEKSFKYLANTVDNLIGLSRDSKATEKTKKDALDLKERFFQHGMQRLSGGIDA
jgi:hypothetical protein